MYLGCLANLDQPAFPPVVLVYLGRLPVVSCVDERAVLRACMWQRDTFELVLLSKLVELTRECDGMSCHTNGGTVPLSMLAGKLRDPGRL